MESLENQSNSGHKSSLTKRIPNWAVTFLTIIIHADFREEIEGDLLEKFQTDCSKYGVNAAKRRLFSEIISLLKFNLIFNLNGNSIMKPKNWLSLFLVAILLIVGSISPFLPGPQNDISHGISQFTQTIGFIGWVFVPFGLVWLIIEIRNKKATKLNRWTNGYYLALLTLTPIFVFIPLQITKAIIAGNTTFDLWPLVIIFSLVGFCIFRIQKLKQKTDYKFNTAPLYIVLIPIVAILSSKLAVEKVASISREGIIEKTEPLIMALETYKNERSEYPEKLGELEGKHIVSLPTFNQMGVRAYQYEKMGSSYQLSFEQNWHWFATEVVVYTKNGHEITKANYENFPTKHPDWRYFMAD